MDTLSIVTRRQLAAIPPPKHTPTFYPIAHSKVLKITRKVFKAAGLTVKDEKICLSKDNLIMTCEWTLQRTGQQGNGSYAPLAVVFNGNDGKHALRVGLGTRVMVCENGMVSAERVFSRKHTLNCERELPELVQGLLDEHRNWHEDLLAFLGDLEKHPAPRNQVNDILVTCMDEDVIPSSHIKKVLDIYRQPTYAEYGHETLYTLHCAFTEVIRDSNPIRMPEKTMALNRVMSQALHGPAAWS